MEFAAVLTAEEVQDLQDLLVALIVRLTNDHDQQSSTARKLHKEAYDRIHALQAAIDRGVPA